MRAVVDTAGSSGVAGRAQTAVSVTPVLEADIHGLELGGDSMALTGLQAQLHRRIG